MKPYRRPCPPSSSNNGGHPKAKFAVPRRNEIVADEETVIIVSSVFTPSSNSELGVIDPTVAPPMPLSPKAQNRSPTRSRNNNDKTKDQDKPPPTPLSPLDQNITSLRSSSGNLSKKHDEPPPTPLSPLALNESHLSSETAEPPPTDTVDSEHPRDSPTPSARILAFDDTLDQTKEEKPAVKCAKGSILPFDNKSKMSLTSITPAANSKCTVAYLGGSDAVMGLPALGARRSCGRLRCASCDFAVVRIAGKRWKADLTYLFLRNSMPSREKIASMLEPDAQAASYACQCSWKVVTRTEKLAFNGTPSDCGKFLQWSCAGHPS